jgi:hypothetical protein
MEPMEPKRRRDISVMFLKKEANSGILWCCLDLEFELEELGLDQLLILQLKKKPQLWRESGCKVIRFAADLLLLQQSTTGFYFFWFGCCGFGNQESGCLNLISPNSSCQKNPLLSSNPLLDSEQHCTTFKRTLQKKERRYFQKLKRDSDFTHTINPKVHYWTPNSKETKICKKLSYKKVHHNCWGPSKVQTWGRAKHKGVQRRRRRRWWRKRLNLLTF